MEKLSEIALLVFDDLERADVEKNIALGWIHRRTEMSGGRAVGISTEGAKSE
ncbi:hypothetical protein R0137_11035 [Congregibacter brevis]|uniref:Uncharacterized protein n=1 Tax=Congregibacter brevis TaxID=3081201 RepID=A0ABZ0ICL1_9GAMM|nr:hypothetical protein R0137_11035 [Congregibacter sp. IMCC45268]